MEYHLTKRQLQRAEYAQNPAAEKPVDVDLTLPDYCPDIERILSCGLIPEIRMTNISSDRLNVEGAATVRVMYTDSAGSARAYEYSSPFSESFPLKEGMSDGALNVEAKQGYLNCRALSPRKLSLHGAFSLRVETAVRTDFEYCGYDDSDDLQIKKEELNISSACGMCTESFTVQEDIPVNDEVGDILAHRLCARITELKAAYGKLMLSAELRLELLYTGKGEKREPMCMSCSVPVSRVIDCSGAAQDTVTDAQLSVLGDTLRLNDDALDGSGLLGLEARLGFSAVCYKEESVELMTDAFSVERDTRLETEPATFESGVSCLSFTDIGKADVGLDEKIGKVIDVHCERVSVSAMESGGTVMLSAKLCAGIMYENSDGELRYAEREAEFSYKPDLGGLDNVIRVRAYADSLSYRLKGDSTLELRAEICYKLCCCRRISLSVIGGISADDSAEPKRDSALVLYYAQDGEKVWDIAKRFSSRPEDIAAENGLETDSLEGDNLLLIPSA